MANKADAEDVAQDAFMRVIAAIERGGGPEALFRPYLLRAVRTAAADRWEEQAKEIPTNAVDETPAEDASLGALLHRDDPELVMKAFQSLPPRWMTVLWHAEVEREPPRRIAPVLGMEPGAVSALLLRARKGLREAYLSAYADAPPRPDCEPTFPCLAATVLGTSSARDRRKVEEHIRECEDCAKVLAELTDVGATMRGVLAPLILLPAGAIHPDPRVLPKSSSSPYGAAVAAAVITAVVGAAATLGSLALSGSSTPVTTAASEPSSVNPAAPAQPPTPEAGSTPSASQPVEPGTGQIAIPSVQDYLAEFVASGPGAAAYAPERGVVKPSAAVMPYRGGATVGAPPAVTTPQPTRTTKPTPTGAPPTPATAPMISPTIAPTPTAGATPTIAPTPTATPTPTIPAPTPIDPGTDPECTMPLLWCLSG